MAVKHNIENFLQIDYYTASNIEKAFEIFYMKHSMKDKHIKL